MHIFFFLQNSERELARLACSSQSAPVFSPLLHLKLLSVQNVSGFSFFSSFPPPLPYIFLSAFRLPVKTGERWNRNIKISKLITVGQTFPTSRLRRRDDLTSAACDGGAFPVGAAAGATPADAQITPGSQQVLSFFAFLS